MAQKTGWVGEMPPKTFLAIFTAIIAAFNDEMMVPTSVPSTISSWICVNLK